MLNWRTRLFLYLRLSGRRLRLPFTLGRDRTLCPRLVAKRIRCRRSCRYAASDGRGEAGALFCLRYGGGVGGQDLHAAVHAAIRYDKRLGAEGQADLAHGFTIGDSEEATDLHAALLPPMMAAIFSMRSSGISMLDSMPICGK